MLKFDIHYDVFRRVLTAILLVQMVISPTGCRRSHRRHSAPMNISVVIIPIGDPGSEALEHLRKELEVKFGNCTVGSKMQIPAKAYNPQRGQYMSGILLERLPEACMDASAGAKVLGVTEEDLYSPRLNFVFGQAQLGGRYAVISLKRLDPEFYNIAPDRSIFLHRMVKEAVHELGHTLGLSHCSNRRCVMHFSNSLWDTDVKGDWFCKRCLAKL